MRVEVLLRRNSDVIVHKDATSTYTGGGLFYVNAVSGNYQYPLRNVLWTKRTLDGIDD